MGRICLQVIDDFLGVIKCFPVLALFLRLSETEEDRRHTDNSNEERVLVLHLVPLLFLAQY